MPTYQVIYSEAVTQEQFAWEGFVETAAGARQAADEHFAERLDGLVEGTDFTVQVNEAG